MKNVRAIIFDWGRTLYDSGAKNEYPYAVEVVRHCASKYRLAIVSLVSPLANATLEERIEQIERSPLRTFFELVRVTDDDKDAAFDEVVRDLGIPRDQILIVDDRTVRGIRYGSRRGHPTVWFQNGKFAEELPSAETGEPTATIHSLEELRALL